jgi:hypothetical protein
MTIELLIYPALVFLAVTVAAKLIERQRDVLYGPYIQGRKSAADLVRDLIEEIIAATGLRRSYGRVAVRFAPVSVFASAIIG